MSPSDGLLATVVADLRHITDEWGDKVDDHSLRRGSTILRRLLVDSDLYRAWRSVGFDREPRITSVTLDPYIKAHGLGNVAFALAGGALFAGCDVACIVTIDVPDGKLWGGELTEPPRSTVGLREYGRSPGIISEGVVIPRTTVIKYIANKLGGAHFDSSRGDKKEQRAFTILDELHRGVGIFDKPYAYFELLAIGQALVASEDVQRLMKHK